MRCCVWSWIRASIAIVYSESVEIWCSQIKRWIVFPVDLRNRYGSPISRQFVADTGETRCHERWGKEPRVSNLYQGEVRCHESWSQMRMVSYLNVWCFLYPNYIPMSWPQPTLPRIPSGRTCCFLKIIRQFPGTCASVAAKGARWSILDLKVCEHLIYSD